MSACSPAVLLTANQPRPVLDRSGIGAGSVPDLRFNAPKGAWTIGWSNACLATYPSSYRAFQMIGLGTTGNHSTIWYQSHRSQVWDEELANEGADNRDGTATVFDHSGTTYLEINSFCAWHVVVWAGTSAEFTPKPMAVDQLPKLPPAPEGDD